MNLMNSVNLVRTFLKIWNHLNMKDMLVDIRN